MRLPARWGSVLLLLLLSTPVQPSRCPQPCACYAPTELHCTFRSLAAVPAGIAQDVERINLGFNSIHALSETSFAGLTKLELLMLHGNEIPAIPDGALRDLSSLQVLKFSYNKLRVVTRRTLQGLSGLVRLHLDHNQLEFIHPQALAGLTALRLLHLEGNSIQHLHPGTFATFSVLGHFRLSTLRHLYLGENRLSRLPQGMLGAMPLLENLYLHANPWACDCQTGWFRNWPAKSKGVLKCKKDKVYDGGQLCAACATPSTFRNRELHTLSDVTCSKPALESPLRLNGSRADPDEEDDEGDALLDETGNAQLPRDVTPTPGWNLTLNMTDEHGNVILLLCDIIKPGSLSDVHLNQTEELEIDVSATVALDVTCPMTRENYEKLWKLIAYYSEVPVKLHREDTGNGAEALAYKHPGQLGYKYRQDSDEETLYYTGVQAQVYAEPAWVMQPTIEIQLNRRLSSAQKVLLSYRAQYSHTVTTKDSTQARSSSWVMIEPGSEAQRSQVVLEGGSCELSCHVKASESPSIFWILPGGTVLRAPTDDADGRLSILSSGWLRIKSTRPSDSGVYQCVAHVTDEADRTEYRVLVLPSADTAPRDSVLSTVHKHPGASVTLPCSESSVPEAVISWLIPHNGMIGPAANTSHAHLMPSGALHMPRVQVRDAGYYTCVAVNRLGWDQFTVELTVQNRFPKGGRRRQGAKGFPRVPGDVDDDENGSGREVTSLGTAPSPEDRDRVIGTNDEAAGAGKRPKKGRRKPKLWDNLEQAPPAPDEGRRMFESRRRVNVASKINPERWAHILARVRGKNLPRATQAPRRTQSSTLPAQTPPDVRSLGPAVSPPPTLPEQTGSAADEASGHASLFHEAPLSTLSSTLPPQTLAEMISLAPATSPPLVSTEQMGNTAEEASGDEEPPWSTQTSTLLPQTPPEVTSLAPAGSPATSKQTANTAEEASADASVLDEHAEPRGPSPELSGGFADATMMEPSAGDSTDGGTAIASRRDLMMSTEDPVTFSVDMTAYSEAPRSAIQDPLTFRENPTMSTEDPKTPTQDTITSIEDLMTSTQDSMTSTQDSMTSTADPVTSPEEQMTYTQVPEASDDNSTQEVTVQEMPGDDIRSAQDSTTSEPETTGGFEHDQAPSTRGGGLSTTPASSPRSPEGHTPVEPRTLTQVQGENRPNYAQPGRPGRKGARKHAQRGRTSGKPPESARQSAEQSEREDQRARSPESGRQHGGPPSLVPTFRSISPTAPVPVWTGENPPESTPSSPGPRRRPGSRKRPRPHRFRPGSSPSLTSPLRVPNTQEPTLLKASPAPGTAQAPEKQRKHRKRPHRPPITAPAVTSVPWASTPNLLRDREQGDVAHSTAEGGLSWTTAPRDVVNSTNAEDSNDITVVGDNTASLKRPVSHTVVLDDVIGPAKSEGSDDVTGTEDSTDSLKVRPSHNAVTNDVTGPEHLEDSAGVVGLTNAQRSVDLIDPTEREDSDDVTDPANTEDSDDIVGVGASAASEVHRSPQDVREAVPSTRHPDAEETKGYDVTAHAGDAKEKAGDVTTGPDSGSPQSAPNSGSDTRTASAGDAPRFPRPTSAWTAARVMSLAPTSGVPPTLSPTLLTRQPSTQHPARMTVHGPSTPASTWAGRTSSPQPEVDPEVLISTQNLLSGAPAAGDVTSGGFPEPTEPTPGTSRPWQATTQNPQRRTPPSTHRPEMSTRQPSVRGITTPILTESSTPHPPQPPRPQFPGMQEPLTRVSSHLPERAHRVPGLRPAQHPRPWSPPPWVALGPPAPPVFHGPASTLSSHTPTINPTHAPWRTPSARPPENSLASGSVPRFWPRGEQPRISTRPPPTLSVPAGSDAVLHCEATGEPRPLVTWKKLSTGALLTPHTRLQRFEVLRNGSLVIRRVQPQDHGQFECSARNLHGLASTLVLLTVSAQPPRILPWAAHDVTVYLGDSLSLRCLAQGNPVPHLAWVLPDGSVQSSATPGDGNGTLGVRDVTSNDKLSLLTVTSSDSSTLHVRDMTSSDRTLHLPDVRSGDRRLRLRDLTSANRRMSRRDVTSSQRTLSRLDVPSADRPANLRAVTSPPSTPVVGDATLPDDTLTLRAMTSPHSTQNRHVMTSAESTLSLRGVTSADRGVYQCVASSAAGTDRTSLRVHVAALPPVVLQARAEMLELEAGRDALLHCSVRAAPPASLRWVLPGRVHIRPSQVLGRKLFLFPNGTLYIRDLGPQDTGRYDCEAANALGWARRTVRLRVQSAESTVHGTRETPRGTPAATPGTLHGTSTALHTTHTTVHSTGETRRSTDVPYGARLHLHCGASGHPGPRVLWRLPSKRLLDPRISFDSRVQVFSNGTLVIQSVTEQDAGDYLCVARDKAGDDYAVLKVNVVTKAAKIERKETNDHRVPRGGTLQVDCVATGLPDPDISWGLPDGRVLHPVLQGDVGWGRSKRYVVFNNGTLYFNEVGAGEEGDYTCFAENRMGKDQMRVRVKVVAEPPVTRKGKMTAGSPVVQNPGAMAEPPVAQKEEVIARLPSIRNPEVTTQPPVIRNGRVMAESPGSRNSEVTANTLLIQNPKVVAETPVFQNRKVVAGALVTRDAEVTAGTPVMRNSQILAKTPFIQNVQAMAEPPVSQNTYSVLQVRYGDKVTVPCRPLGHLGAKVTWWSPTNRQIPVSSDKYQVDAHGTLLIHKAQRSDSGNYTCSTRSSAGEDRKTVWIQVQVRPPSIRRPSDISGGRSDVSTRQSDISGGRSDVGTRQSDVGSIVHETAAEGTRKLINCRAEGIPMPTVLWAFPGGVILPAPYHGNRVAVHGNGTLDFRSVRKSDSMELQCIARNEGGEARMTVRLGVLDSVIKPVFHQPIHEPITASPGHTISLNCSASGNPPPTLSWVLPNGTELHGGQRLRRFFHKRDGMLHISGLAAADAGTYRCVAGNTAGHSERLVILRAGLTPEVRTLGKVKPEVRKAEVIAPDVNKHHPDVLSVVHGETLLLPCPGSRGPQSHVSWTLPNGMILEAPQSRGRVSVSDDGTLTVQQVSVFDRGTYVCKADSRSDPVVTSIPVIVIAYPPRITSEPTPVIYIRPGNTVKLNCLAMGIPKPEISWELPDKSRLTAGAQARLHGNQYLHPQGSLSIQHASHGDAGLYRCTAKNILGVDVKTSYIHVY